MAWDSEMVMITRAIIDDIDTPYTYTDSPIKNLILSAAQLVQTEFSFANTYTVNITGVTLTPDPTLPDTPREEIFINLTCLKAGCLLARGESKTRSGRAISVRDGKSAVSTDGAATISRVIANDMCQAYEDAKWDYQKGASSTFKAVVSPFRFQWGGNPPPGYEGE